MTQFRLFIDILWANRRVLAMTTLVELKKRHAGSILGWAWVMFYPLLLLGMYLFVYQAVMKVRITGMSSSIEYSLYALAGIVPYIAFAEVLCSSISLLAQNRHLIVNVIVPPEIIPIRQAAMSMIVQGVGLGLIMLLAVTMGGRLSLAWLWLPPMLVLEFLFLAGLAFIFSALGVLLRDLAQVMPVLTMFLLFISPIGYTRAMVPDNLKAALWLNPLVYLVDSLREPLLYGRLPDPLQTAVYAGAALSVFWLGGLLFKKVIHTLNDLI
jgi:lipopolysaccharide transport system permease protein